MKLETPRNLALLALNRLSRKPVFSGNCLDEVFRSHAYLSSRDRAFINHLVQGVLRWRLRLDWIIAQSADSPKKKITPPILNILRLALYQIFFLDRVPESAAVNEAVKQAKSGGTRHLASFVNGILRNICRQKDKITFPDRDRDPQLYLSVFYSYPDWLVENWIEEWGTEFTENLLLAGNRIPSLTLRANLLRLSRSGLMKRLEEQGIIAKPTPYSPEGILIEDFRGGVEDIVSFGEGLFQVQDQAAQITSHLLAPEPGETILDICAGFGGKTTHLAELMGDKGLVLALDISTGRLINLVKNSRRLGVGSISAFAADASGSLSSLVRIKFDKIMVDAPCSGLGVLSRHPDGKWNRNEGDIKRLALLQKAIINEAVSVLKSGGKMLYVTCTISKKENEGVVNSCLAGNQDILLKNIKDHVPGWGKNLIDDQGFFKTFPHIHHMDGFFAALFQKK